MISVENNLFTTNKIVKIVTAKSTKKVFKITTSLENISVNSHFKNQSFAATEEHLIFDANKKKYQQVRDLKIGDFLLNQQNQKIKIIEKKLIPYDDYIYDISLENSPNNYFANGVLVHNKTFAPSAFDYAEITILNKIEDIKIIQLPSIKINNKHFITYTTYNAIVEKYYSSYYYFKVNPTKEQVNETNQFYYRKGYILETLTRKQEENNVYKSINSSIDIFKLPIKFYDENGNFVFQITNKLSKLVNPKFDDEKKIITGALTIDDKVINNPFYGTTKED